VLEVGTGGVVAVSPRDQL